MVQIMKCIQTTIMLEADKTLSRMLFPLDLSLLNPTFQMENMIIVICKYWYIITSLDQNSVERSFQFQQKSWSVSSTMMTGYYQCLDYMYLIGKYEFSGCFTFSLVNKLILFLCTEHIIILADISPVRRQGIFCLHEWLSMNCSSFPDAQLISRRNFF